MRRRRDEPSNPFTTDFAAIRQRRQVQQTEIIERTIRSVESLIQSPGRRRSTRDLQSPSSPKIKVPFDKKLNEQTENVKAKVKSSLQQRRKQVTITKEVTNLSEINNIMSELDNELMADLKKYLIENEIPLLKQQSVLLAKQKNLDPNKDMWHEELKEWNRELNILEYEARIEDNNRFLKCFDINSLDGNYIRALWFCSDCLLKSRTATHIKDGKIFCFQNGVRIILDSRRTLESSLRQSGKIWAYVGPHNEEVCLINTNPKEPGPDQISKLIMLSNNGWPDWIVDEIDGDGTLSIKYQLKKWESEEYSSAKILIDQHYKSMGEMIHSIEVYSRERRIIIGTLLGENKGKLIGKKGRNTNKISELMKSQTGGQWSIHVQELQ